MKEMNLNP